MNKKESTNGPGNINENASEERENPPFYVQFFCRVCGSTTTVIHCSDDRCNCGMTPCGNNMQVCDYERCGSVEPVLAVLRLVDWIELKLSELEERGVSQITPNMKSLITVLMIWTLLPDENEKMIDYVSEGLFHLRETGDEIVKWQGQSPSSHTPDKPR